MELTKGNKIDRRRDVWMSLKLPLLFMFPAVLSLVLFQLFPLAQGAWISLLESNKSTIADFLKAPFIGLNNYLEILVDGESQVRQGLWDALRNTVLYTFVVTLGTTALGLGAALLVHREFPGRSLARTLLLFSWIIPSYVVGMLWGFMWQQEEGIVNQVVFNWLHFDVVSSWFGVHWQYSDLGELIRPSWLTGENTFWAIVIPTIWRFWPFAMVMFLAGLASIPKEIYEAGQMDGANQSERFFHITLPLLRPVIAMLGIQGLITNMYSFNIVSMMFGNGSGFPGKYGDLMMPNVFRNSFQMWNFGIGAAISTLLMIFMVIIVGAWYRRFREDMGGQ